MMKKSEFSPEAYVVSQDGRVGPLARSILWFTALVSSFLISVSLLVWLRELLL